MRVKLTERRREAGEVEAELVNRARRGDRSALEELFRRTYPGLKSFLTKLTLDEYLAEEIAQEAACRALAHLDGYRPQARFFTWMASIAVNIWRNLRRNAGRTVPLAVFPERAAADDPAEAAEQREIRSLLAALPQEKRVVMVLKHYEGLTYEEIAAVLRCPVGTVRSRMHDALAILRREAQRRGMI